MDFLIRSCFISMVRKNVIEGGRARRDCKTIVQIFRISALGIDSRVVIWRTGEDMKNCFGVWSLSFCCFSFVSSNLEYIFLGSILSSLLSFYQVGMYVSWLR